MRLLDDPALLEAELERRLEAGRETDPQRRRLAELQGERERLERAGARLVTAYQEELIGLDELCSRMPAIRSRKRVLEAELEAIETAAEERERYLRIAETLESFRERLRAGAASLDVIERQKVLRSLVKEVLVDEGEITIRHSIPLTESGSPSHGKPAADLPQRNPKPQSYLLRWGRHRGALWRPLSSPVAPGSCDACRPPRPAPAFLPFCPSQKSQKLTSKLTSIYTDCVKKSQKLTSIVDFIDKLCETLDVVTRLGGEGPLGLHSVVGGLS